MEAPVQEAITDEQRVNPFNVEPLFLLVQLPEVGVDAIGLRTGYRSGASGGGLRSVCGRRGTGAFVGGGSGGKSVLEPQVLDVAVGENEVRSSVVQSAGHAPGRVPIGWVQPRPGEVIPN